jgi:uncharacterized protein
VAAGVGCGRGIEPPIVDRRESDHGVPDGAHDWRKSLNGDLKSRLQEELIRVRKERDRLTTVVLSSTLSEVRNREIEVGHPLDDEEIQAVIAKAIKQRREAADQMRQGDRLELAEKEEKEAEVLTAFLPPQLDEAEVRAIVEEAIREGPAEVGPVMGKVMPRLRGLFDGREANRIVREMLS